MFNSIWEYQVEEKYKAEFLRVYGSSGDWAQLFSKAEGYICTKLLEDKTNSSRFITIDQWQSEKDFHNFKKIHNSEYSLLDKASEKLTISEHSIGYFILK